MKTHRILRTALWVTIGAGLLTGYGIPAATNKAEAATRKKSASKKKPAVAPKSFNGNIGVAPIPLTEGENVLYTVNKNGYLEWHKHSMKVGIVTVPGSKVRKRGLIHSMTAPKKIGMGWGMRQVFPGTEHTIYGISNDGTLRWFRHDGYETGKYDWAQDTVVGSGWNNFRKVISMDKGVLYAWSANGELRWYKHNQYTYGGGGEFGWEQNQLVGKHWNFQDVFGGGNGVIYAVTEDGKLMWYRHRNYLSAVPTSEDNPQVWQQSWDGPKQIGSGWDQFTNIFSPGNGEIYAIKPTGELMYYQHLGWRTGAMKWGVNAVVAKGWGDYDTVFARVKTGDRPRD
ncbi:hypothetical protein EON83_15005 [bacterium]|nr:MAG: hypothetical protein EON83_15005 [bacterium]